MTIHDFIFTNPYSGCVWAVLIVMQVLWLWSVVIVAKEKTEDPYDRIVWLLVVLILNFMGTLLYVFCSGLAPAVIRQKRHKPEVTKLRSEAELKQCANDGTL